MGLWIAGYSSHEEKLPSLKMQISLEIYQPDKEGDRLPLNGRLNFFKETEKRSYFEQMPLTKDDLRLLRDFIDRELKKLLEE